MSLGSSSWRAAMSRQHRALVDAIDARYGPRLRVLSEEVLAQYWPSETEIGSTATKSECRERESNPYTFTSTAP